MKNWKTTSTGIGLIVSSIAGLFFAHKTNALDAATVSTASTGLLGGIGLLFAKDHNVTGVK